MNHVVCESDTAAPWHIVLPSLGTMTRGQKNLCWMLGSLSTWMGGDLTSSEAQEGKGPIAQPSVTVFILNVKKQQHWSFRGVIPSYCDIGEECFLLFLMAIE